MNVSTEVIVQCLIIAFNLLTGLFVLLKRPTNVLHQAFFMLTLGGSLWGCGLILLAKTQNFAVFDKVTIYGFMVMLVGLVMFARVFPNAAKVTRRFYAVFVPLAALAALTPFNLIIKQAVVLDGHVQPTNGPLFPAFAVISVAYIAFALVMFACTYCRSFGAAKRQMQYLLLGLGLFVTSAMIFGVVLPLFGVFHLNFLGPSSSIFLTLGTAYAIVRHELLDIRVVIQRGLVYTILSAIVIGLYVIALEVSAYVLHLLTEESAIVSAGITTTVGVFFLKPVETYFRKKTDHIFFKDAYDYADALHSLSRITQTSLNREDILLQSEATLRQIFKTDSVTFVLDPSEVEGVTDAEQSEGFATISQPIMFEDKAVGILRLGAKRSGDMYTKRDRQLLSTFAFQAAVALGKADLHDEVRRYSSHLEQLVDSRTIEIKRMQEDQKQTMIDISHNLQTPLAIIRGELESLEALGETGKEFDRIGTVKKSIDRVSGFIRQLLHLARLERSLYTVEQRPLSLSNLMRDQVEYFEVMAEQEGVRVETSVAAGCRIMGNKRLIEELFVNLVTNAITYRDEARTAVIRICLKRDGGHVVATVADNGIGIPEKDLPEIFQRFYRVPNAANALQGTGLGLAIVKNIAERHKATIVAESVVGEGTTFIVTFPAL